MLLASATASSGVRNGVSVTTGLYESQTLVAGIVPAERWTRPLASNIGEARVFARPGAVFYMTLTEASRFDEADYLPVVSPQAEPVAGRSVWIGRKPSDVRSVNVTWVAGDSTDFKRQLLKTEQTRGSGFGYRIRAAREGETPDLDAFVINVPSDPSVTRGSIAIPGHYQPSFLREVVVVHPRRAGLGLALALLPLVAYLLFIASRRLRKPSSP